jgi:hypothetical protein
MCGSGIRGTESDANRKPARFRILRGSIDGESAEMFVPSPRALTKIFGRTEVGTENEAQARKR